MADIDLSDNPLGFSLPGFAGSTPQGLASPAPATANGPTQEEKIRAWAQKYGVDPAKALGVAGAEGLNAWSKDNPNAASGVDIDENGKPFSFGDFQLNVKNGLGVEALKAGIDPRDPAQRDAADEFAIKYMAENGLGPWRNDKYVKGLNGGGGAAGATAGTTSSTPVAEPSTAGGLSINPKGLYQLAMLQALAPLHRFVPVDYDPFKVMPHQSGEGN